MLIRGYIVKNTFTFIISDPEVVFPFSFKVRLWVMMRDQTLTHLCIDISLIPQHILDHNVSLKS